MFSLMKLISKKSLCVYFIIYLNVQLFCIGIPIISANFLDYIIDGNIPNTIKFGLINFLSLLIYQSLLFWLDLKEGQMICEAWNNFCNLLLKKINKLDWSVESISSNDLQQIMGQEYEQVKNYFFKSQIDLSMSLLTILLIECILFVSSRAIFYFTIVAVPISIMLSSKNNAKLTESSQDNLDDMIQIKRYIEDNLLLSKEERTHTKKHFVSFTWLQEKYAVSFLKKIKRQSFSDNIISFGSLNLVVLLTTMMTGYEVYTGTLTIGGLYAVQLLVSNLWSPSEKLIEIKNDYANSKPMIRSILNFINKKEATDSHTEIDSIILDKYVSLDQNGKDINIPLSKELLKNNIYIIRGENGVGKTTLVEALIGYTQRYKGRILINKKSIQKGTINKFVYIPAKPYLSQFYGKGYGNLSFGQQKQIQIQLALDSDGTAFIFDEPTNYLDICNKQSILDSILRIATNRIIIIVTHDDYVMQYLQNKKIEVQYIELIHS